MSLHRHGTQEFPGREHQPTQKDRQEPSEVALHNFEAGLSGYAARLAEKEDRQEAFEREAGNEVLALDGFDDHELPGNRIARADGKRCDGLDIAGTRALASRIREA